MFEYQSQSDDRLEIQFDENGAWINVVNPISGHESQLYMTRKGLEKLLAALQEDVLW